MKKTVTLPTAYLEWAKLEANIYCDSNGHKRNGPEWQSVVETLISDAYTHSLTPGQDLNPQLAGNPSPRKMGQDPLDHFKFTRKGGIIEKSRMGLQRKNWMITVRVMLSFLSNIYMGHRFPSLKKTMSRAKEIFTKKEGKDSKEQKILILQGKYVEIYIQTVYLWMIERMVDQDLNDAAQKAVVNFFDSFMKANEVKGKDRFLKELFRQENKDLFAKMIYNRLSEKDADVKFYGEAPAKEELLEDLRKAS